MKCFLQVPSPPLTYFFPLLPAGFKSQEERQKEEIHKFWHRKSAHLSHIIFVYNGILCYLTYLKRYQHLLHLFLSHGLHLPFAVWPPVCLFLSCLPGPGPFPVYHSVCVPVCVCVCVCVCVRVCQVTLLSFKVESEYTFVDFIRGG